MQSADKEVRDRTRRSFLVAGVAATAGVAGWRWLATRPEDEGVAWPFRRALRFNERLANGYFGDARPAQTFDPARAEMPRANGDVGLSDDVDKNWKLETEGLVSPASITLADIRSLPRVDVTTELKCIEGWSTITHWTGARLADFAQHFGARRTEYVSLVTPDEEYYVGLDRPSAFHPQTLLCYEMNGAPLQDEHGAPLRLAIPVKYGIKHLKRIGKISFTNERPADYWAERGYDWYAGL